MGITAISVGVGAAIPSINLIAKPIVCPNGDMTTQSQVYRPYPGKTVTSMSWYCIEGGETRPLSLFPIAMISGSAYGLGLFVLLVLIGLLRGRSSSPNAF